MKTYNFDLSEILNYVLNTTNHKMSFLRSGINRGWYYEQISIGNMLTVADREYEAETTEDAIEMMLTDLFRVSE